MIKPLLKVVVFTVSTALSSFAAATSYPMNNSSSYFGIGYGYGDFNTTATASNVALTNDNQAGTLFLGHTLQGKKVNYGFEASANAFKQKKWTIVGDVFTLRTRTIELAGVIELPKDNGFFQIKAGAAYVQQETKLNVIDPLSSLPLSDMGETNYSLRPLAGVTVGFNLNKHVKADISYTHVFAQESSPPISTASNIASTADFNKIASLDSVLLRLSYIV